LDTLIKIQTIDDQGAKDQSNDFAKTFDKGLVTGLKG
jgi:hypothetical protein